MKRILWITIAALVFAVPVLRAQEMTVEEIVSRANLAAYYAGQDGLSDVKMTITDAQGRNRTREFRILRLDAGDGGEQKFFVYFNKPSDVARMVYMVWKHLGKDDDRWLYLPALDLVKRIAAGDKRSSFVGSHFVYEDVSGRSIEADTHELVETTDEYYQLKNVPKDPKGTEFAYYLIWISRANFLPVKAEYYNAENNLIRSIEALEIQDIQGHATAVKTIARDLERKGETVMEFSNVQYDTGLTDDVFTERYLRKPPVKWIR